MNDTDPIEELKHLVNSVIEIDDTTLNTIITRFECRKIVKNNVLLKQGGKCDFWGFVVKGLIRVYSFSNSGDESTNGFVREGEFITESMSFFTPEPSLENMEALEDTKVFCINQQGLKQLYAEVPVFEKFTRILYEQRMVELKARIQYRIQFDGQGKYNYFVKSQPELYRRVPLKYIASYLNLTDSTLSRIRRKAVQ